MLLVLVVVLGGAWFWRSRTEASPPVSVDYSVFFAWLESGKLESVAIRGPVLDGALKVPQSVAGGQTKEFHTVRPDGDDGLVPLLREKKVHISVKSEEQTLPVQLLLGSLPATHAIEDEARSLLSHALAGASALLADHRGELTLLERALLEKETVDRDELRALFRPGAVGVGATTP